MIQIEIVPILISSLFRLIVVMFLNHKLVMLGVSVSAVIMLKVLESKVSVKSGIHVGPVSELGATTL